MEFTSRGNNQQSAPQASGRRKHIDWAGRAIRIEWFIFTCLVAIILLIAIFWLIFSSPATNSEAKNVNSSEFQAVFLNNGQVYFGKLETVNNNYFVLKNVYYLQSPSNSSSSSSSSSTNTNYTLEKLGVNELHAPEDEMVINRSQVTFWENLKSSGKVVQAIEQYQKNPNAGKQVQGTGTGQSSTANQSTGSNSSNSSTSQP